MPALLFICLIVCAPCTARAEIQTLEAAGEAQIDLYCLRASYPQILGLAVDGSGQWLLLADGRRVLYAAPEKASGRPPASGPGREDCWDVDVRASMAEPYPLEPERPATPLGLSPGRRRSHALLAALYGHSRGEVSAALRQARLLGKPLRLISPAALALREADTLLAVAVRQRPELAALLKPAGGFAWRRIAGERRLSPHAFGIALDLSPERAPYWRWSGLRPHPLQQSYPEAIVAAFEAAGFIWGGKWHEYDIMHFEYRPELICKARVLLGLKKLRAAQGGASD